MVNNDDSEATITREQLAELRKLLEAATPGEWYHVSHLSLVTTRETLYRKRPGIANVVIQQHMESEPEAKANGELIPLMHNMLSALLDAAEDGLRYRLLVEHDPVGLEEIEGMIQSRRERVIRRQTMRVERLLSSPEKLIIWGSDPNYHVVAKANQAIKVGDTIEYEPYGAANWGTFANVIDIDVWRLDKLRKILITNAGATPLHASELIGSASDWDEARLIAQQAANGYEIEEHDITED